MSENNKEDFRIKTREWLEKNCPMSMRGKTDDIKELYWGGENTSFTSEDQKKWFEAMSLKGWVAPQWEEKYGGGGLSILENKILIQEMSRLKCKQPLIKVILFHMQNS